MAVFALLANGIRVWQRTSVDSGIVDVHLLLERLDADCANLTPLGGWLLKTDGTSLHMLCVTGSAAGTGERVARVEYRFDPKRQAIERLQTDYPATGEERALGRVMLAPVESCVFSVLYDDPQRNLSEWIGEWPRSNASQLPPLPRQVRVMLGRPVTQPQQVAEQLTHTIPLMVQK